MKITKPLVRPPARLSLLQRPAAASVAPDRSGGLVPPLALGKSPAMPVANSIAAERAKHAGDSFAAVAMAPIAKELQVLAVVLDRMIETDSNCELVNSAAAESICRRVYAIFKAYEKVFCLSDWQRPKNQSRQMWKSKANWTLANQYYVGEEDGLAGPARRRGGAGRQEPGRALRAALPCGRRFALLCRVQGGPAPSARPRGPRRPVLPTAKEHPLHAAVDGRVALVENGWLFSNTRQQHAHTHTHACAPRRRSARARALSGSPRTRSAGSSPRSPLPERSIDVSAVCSNTAMPMAVSVVGTETDVSEPPR